MWLGMINNVSISVSLYCLVLFYMATEERLAPFDPFYKFLTVKAILFFSFWQACLFQVLYVWDVISPVKGSLVLNLIIAVEIVGAAVAQAIAFNYKDFIVEYGTNENRFTKR